MFKGSFEISAEDVVVGNYATGRDGSGAYFNAEVTAVDGDTITVKNSMGVTTKVDRNDSNWTWSV